MSYGRNPECLFFSEDGEGSVAALASIAPDIPEDATEAQVKEAMEREVCPRPTCRLTYGNLARCLLVASLEEIPQQVPPDCSWSDVVHEV